MKGIATLIDERHSEGKGVFAKNIVAYLYDKFNITIHRTHASRLLKKLGLTQAPVESTQNTFASHRKKEIRDFLVKLNEIICTQNNGDDSYVLVFTDKSYVNTNHGNKRSYLHKDSNKNKGLKLKKGK